MIGKASSTAQADSTAPTTSLPTCRWVWLDRVLWGSFREIVKIEKLVHSTFMNNLWCNSKCFPPKTTLHWCLVFPNNNNSQAAPNFILLSFRKAESTSSTHSHLVTTPVTFERSYQWFIFSVFWLKTVQRFTITKQKLQASVRALFSSPPPLQSFYLWEVAIRLLFFGLSL